MGHCVFCNELLETIIKLFYDNWKWEEKILTTFHMAQAVELYVQQSLLKLTVCGADSCFDTAQKNHYPPGNQVTSKNVLFPDHSHLLTTSTDDPSLAGAWAIIKVLGHQYQWLAGGYDLELGHI